MPEIDSYIGLMHTLFALEDMYGLKIGEIDGEVCLRLDKSAGSTYSTMFDMFHAWQEQAARLEQGEITKEEYDQWRYKYPELDTSKQWRKVIPSQGTQRPYLTETSEDRPNTRQIFNLSTDAQKTLPTFSFISENQ